MPAAAKEETIFSTPGDPCALFPLAAFEGVPKNSHQGVERKNRSLHPGFERANCQTALGDTGSVAGNLHRDRLFYKFTGHERDSESGLDHTENRQYSSMTARWLSPDPTSGSCESPQSWNAYSYVKGDPTDFTDPDGLSPCGSLHAYYVGGVLGGFTDASWAANGATLASLINAKDDTGLMARVVFAESDSGASNPPSTDGSAPNNLEKEAIALSIQNRVDILNGTIQIQGVSNVSTLGYGPAGASLRDVLGVPGQYASVNQMTVELNSTPRSNLDDGLNNYDASSAVCTNITSSYFAAYTAVNHFFGVFVNDPFAGTGVVTSFHHGGNPSASLETAFGSFGSLNNFFGFPFINGKPTARPRIRKPTPIPLPVM